ncbi:MAG TPA: Gfo/Idh/MocA family oxidoreductase [Candidatus Dormibacteraeota bacterium]|nr:Gfo/Idh/MocA family oxidoreductase [Candidatus Dormibacteraeota bacterium]
MSDAPSSVPSFAPNYVMIGRGQWSRRMNAILTDEGHAVSTIEETRRRPDESELQYVARLAESMKKSAAQIAWICVWPGPHVSLMIQAALEAGLHVIVEKPWYGTPEDTQRLQSQAAANARTLAVHFEYLMLDEVEQWRREHHPGTGLQFGGNFFLNRPDRTNTPALDNLGCHLLAIREHVCPAATIAQLHCAYERPDERVVWLEKNGEMVSAINLLTHRQPIIQRFIKKVEAALSGGAAFPFDLNFALRVVNAVNACKARNDQP